MRIKEIMRVPVDVIDPLTTVAAVARKMRDEDVGCLLVGRPDRLVGVITDRDIVVRVLASGQNPDRELVWNVMSSEVLCCVEEQPVDEAARIMEEHGVRRLPVLDRRGRLRGIVSRSDLDGGASRKELFAVTFYKELTDGCGILHEVPLATVYVTGVDSEDQPAARATPIFERKWRPDRWKGAADGCRVDRGY